MHLQNLPSWHSAEFKFSLHKISWPSVSKVSGIFVRQGFVCVGTQYWSADVLSGRGFVRTGLDVFFRTTLNVLSGRRLVRTVLCDIFFRPTDLDVLSGRRFVRTALQVVVGGNELLWFVLDDFEWF